MTAKTVPITGSVLGWAREEAGLSRLDLAERVARPVGDIEAWEAGAGRPTKGQFTKLVEALKRPSAVFFLPEPPASASMPTALRRAPGLGGHRIGPEEALQIRWARRLQEITSWVLEDSGREPAALERRGLQTNPADLAEDIRRISDIPPEEQLAWPNLSTAFRTWRSYLKGQNMKEND